MKMNKTLLKYEIANGNGLLGPFVAIMRKTFIFLFLYASKKDTLFSQYIYSGKLSRAQRFACILAAWFIQFSNRLEAQCDVIKHQDPSNVGGEFTLNS